jgi:hypothetical protein
MIQTVPSRKELKECVSCGEATTSEYCKGCWLKEQLEK